MIDFDAVVLAGGGARRLGGVDKTALRVGGRTLLDHAIEACAGAGRVVVAGPARATARPVTWVREDPPGSGPVAALAAALERVGAPYTVVLAADQPFATEATVRRLVAALAARTGEVRDAGGARDTGGARGAGAATGAGDAGAADPVAGVVLVDAGGRDQFLFAVYATAALRARLGALGDPRGASLRALAGPLRLARVRDEDDAAFDCDTWADVHRARTRSGRMSDVLEDWIAAAKAELGVDLDVDIDALLDMTKVAAHSVARPAAPLTAFLVGYAAATRGGGPDEVARALRQAERLAERYAAEPAADPQPAAAGPDAGSPAAGPDAESPGAGGPAGSPAAGSPAADHPADPAS